MSLDGASFVAPHSPSGQKSPSTTLPTPPPEAAPAAVPEPGDLVGGVYRVLGPLGSGAMGVVLLANDESLGRRVAIKLIRANLLEETFRERFTMEARAMARVNHPNALQIYAFGVHDGAPYFVMELVVGLTLDVWMENNPRPDLDTAINMLSQICSGVAAIHAASTVHRDIKPSNILVDETQRLRVADLGLAILLRHEGDLQHEIVGTPAYMAPEVAFPGGTDDGLGDRADVYSLACVAYELVTGRLPFVTDGDRAMMFQHAVLPAQPPSVFRADLPRALDDAIMRALAKKPAERTPSVDAFRAALEAARTQTLDPPRILIADDNDDFRELLASGLESAFPSSQIECVRDGRSALDAFDRHRPSVMICDLAMPNMDGMSLAQLLRTRDPDALVAILVLTGSGGPEEWARLSAIGVHRLLVKPVVLDDVVSIIRRLMKDQILRTASAHGTTPRMGPPVLTG